MSQVAPAACPASSEKKKHMSPPACARADGPSGRVEVFELHKVRGATYQPWDRVDPVERTAGPCACMD